MRLAPAAVLLSFLLSLALIGAALWPIAARSDDNAGYGLIEWTRLIAVLLVIIGISSWPWLVAYISASNEDDYRASILFAITTVVLALRFYFLISDAPAEGVGYNVIFFVLLAWVAYPVSLIARTKKK